jgi:hypothetical protein
MRNGWGYQPGMKAPYYYPGIDYAPTGNAALAVPVYAAADGKVTVAGPDSGGVTKGYGLHIRIDHGDGDLTLYGHLKLTRVKVGDQVKAGQVIGVMGNTGNSSGRHLHFEFRRKGYPKDPTELLFPAGNEVVEETDGPAPVSFQNLSYVKVIIPFLNIREAPSLAGRITGSIGGDTITPVIGSKDVDDITWLQIGYKQYIAKRQGNSVFAVWVGGEPKPAPAKLPTDINPTVGRWEGLAKKYAELHDLDYRLILAVIWVESGGDPDAVSEQGAVGLMQVMPSDGMSKKLYGSLFANRPATKELLDPAKNIMHGSAILADMVNSWGVVREGLLHYGPTRVGYDYADKVLASYESLGGSL